MSLSGFSSSIGRGIMGATSRREDVVKPESAVSAGIVGLPDQRGQTRLIIRGDLPRKLGTGLI